MFIYAANWKMNMSFDKAIGFCGENYEDFVAISGLKDKKIVLFPEFTQIKSIHDIFKDTKISIGAQDCSVNEPGAFTGQVSVESLAQIGCIYCIIGHSEVREYIRETPEELAVKILRLSDSKITPIFCVGEFLQDFLGKKYDIVIREQLEAVFELIAGYCDIDFYIAYEPVYSIGTGMMPEICHVEEVFDLILQVACKFKLDNKIKLMYGGSVDEKNVQNFKKIKNLSGFLIGSASLDFKKFKKIVEL
ncbi:MAG: Triosephosphate isomerase [candidate division TM6 bacterium GW2011_GWF2_30_66]|jgi:triosephosphate isomerase|nr:MAG: Triosephosphate isomerase [candidate division TM6 bacterium GW2011_GWF2_30_66]